MVLDIHKESFLLERYPQTKDNNLRAWSNAELMALDYVKDYDSKTIHTFNDRFGVWSCVLNKLDVRVIITHASQQKAIVQNLERNSLDSKVSFLDPLEDYKRVDLALIKTPKSLELFELFLYNIHRSAHENTEVICCFMTKHFSKSMLEIAELYFETTEQTKAWKKARLLILKKPKKDILAKELVNRIEFDGNLFLQYYGVFSSSRIDIGTKFFLENINIKNTETRVLDLACGNGVIGYVVTEQNPEAEVTFIDDFSLAIESAKINLNNKKAVFICSDTIIDLKGKEFDVVLSNPPFHFEFENNIEVSLSLFEMVCDCLKKEGRFVLVANKHLNYKTHLSKIFNSVEVIKENKKFMIYECLK
ncbi:23S rRNA (guanine1835-N2)-methyltransferase [Tenacibaculum sp. MAR_2009_124]|uniref:methyltransferase n=1 Tax=Tenacibaculum sp. MAR_2009_124 TaxID=1250059 RepID=UPI000895F4EC|nr:methyltransferase [Tenacibaculum sp. MAR_2009_124]SEC85977.1 23S rRNA (guanine1835-N2)-methyltransferase [Tenacibaculum sp. MAR_2009_124]